MEFHVPQDSEDRIRIFIPGFDSNPCVFVVNSPSKNVVAGSPGATG